MRAKCFSQSRQCLPTVSLPMHASAWEEWQGKALLTTSQEGWEEGEFRLGSFCLLFSCHVSNY